ncbi:MAG: 5-oxoprolinase subunit PxpB [Gammaproteobacteria bacterium]|nr:5-oxoprolinase subunit PxpB [Gammaproteobacteria bacterium]
MELRYVLTRCGDDLLSLSVASPPDAQALAAHLRETGAWIDVVAGIDSVVVHFDAAALDAATAQQQIKKILALGIPPLQASEDLLEIPVVYGGEFGPDFEDLCRQLGLSRDEFISLHTGIEYRVDMVGFTPGFAFVGGLDERLHAPRRKEPRQRVEAGSIGIADGRTGLYALASPGGWSLVGRTPAKLFDAEATEPFTLRAGMRIRFHAISVVEASEFGT